MEIIDIKFQNLESPSDIWHPEPSFEWDKVKIKIDIELIDGIDVNTMCEDIVYKVGLKKIIRVEYDYNVQNCSQHIVQDEKIVRIILDANKI